MSKIKKQTVVITIKNQKFGIEIELTGLTGKKAAEVIAEHFGNPVTHYGGSYDAYHVDDDKHRIWKIMYDASITPQTKTGDAGYNHKVELVSPICAYDDILAGYRQDGLDVSKLEKALEESMEFSQKERQQFDMNQLWLE